MFDQYWILVILFIFLTILVSIQYVLNQILKHTREMLRLLRILVNRDI
ncbi:MAG: hypothetical protein Q4A72_02985 [Bacillota bacterium]|nr:hypothetical protein [Bacillota bacterium]